MLHALFAKKLKKFKELPLPSLGLATIGLIASIVTALLLPGKIYEYITTAAGILILFNWSFIIISALRILENKIWGKILAFIRDRPHSCCSQRNVDGRKHSHGLFC